MANSIGFVNISFSVWSLGYGNDDEQIETYVYIWVGSNRWPSFAHFLLFATIEIRNNKIKLKHERKMFNAICNE